MFRPGGFNTVIKLIRFLVGANRHTLTAITLSNMTRLFSFCSEQNAQACIASVESARDRFEKTLGDDGVLLLPAATKSAPFHNQDLMFFDSPGMTALFNLFRVPVTVCPVLRLVDGLPLCVQVCERHFKAEDIVRETSYIDQATGRTVTAPLLRLRLQAEAVPTVFPDCPSYLSIESFRREDPESKRMRLEAASFENVLAESLLPAKKKEEEADKLCDLKDVANFVQGKKLTF
ncbi:hypothetical protein HPB51_008368 [Rhipicephalus microplus]|uniref:Uncharacterized protein n=1 Tax=Rhipicephalus microplus TaxID=6941 RepID=A0A9J6DTC7_RHIMP|nr:hypothetical protein HPB51_008368 [Rhipicephalus microplus]